MAPRRNINLNTVWQLVRINPHLVVGIRNDKTLAKESPGSIVCTKHILNKSTVASLGFSCYLKNTGMLQNTLAILSDIKQAGL